MSSRLSAPSSSSKKEKNHTDKNDNHSSSTKSSSIKISSSMIPSSSILQKGQEQIGDLISSTTTSLFSQLQQQQQQEQGNNNNKILLHIKCSKYWDIELGPIKKHMVGGYLVTAVKGFGGSMISKQRRVIVQIMTSNSTNDDENENNNKKNVFPTSALEWNPGDRVIFRVLKPRQHWGFISKNTTTTTTTATTKLLQKRNQLRNFITKHSTSTSASTSQSNDDHEQEDFHSDSSSSVSSSDDDHDDHDDDDSLSSDTTSTTGTTTTTFATKNNNKDTDTPNNDHYGYVDHAHFDLDQIQDIQILPDGNDDGGDDDDDNQEEEVGEESKTTSTSTFTHNKMSHFPFKPNKKKKKKKMYSMEARFFRGNQTKVRNVRFSTKHERDEFVTIVNQLRSIIHESLRMHSPVGISSSMTSSSRTSAATSAAAATTIDGVSLSSSARITKQTTRSVPILDSSSGTTTTPNLVADPDVSTTTTTTITNETTTTSSPNNNNNNNNNQESTISSSFIQKEDSPTLSSNDIPNRNNRMDSETSSSSAIVAPMTVDGSDRIPTTIGTTLDGSINTTMNDNDNIDNNDNDNIDNDVVNLLIEIVSASDLPATDAIRRTSDPYVKVWLGQQEIHTTSTIFNTLDPIWTVDTGSLFLLSMSLEEFYSSSTTGLTFIVQNFDPVGRKGGLGKVILSQHEVLAIAEQNKQKNIKNNNNNNNNSYTFCDRTECLLDDLFPGTMDNNNNSNMTKKAAILNPPKLTLRIREATPKDYKFIKILHKIRSKKKLGVYVDSTYVAPKPHRVRRLKRQTKVGAAVAAADGSSSPSTLYLVKPGPDPDREEAATKWLTKEQINNECMKPSTRWIETGSGKTGYLFIEILKCDNLPNLDDRALDSRDVTDAFCGIIYEDAIVHTDVINDELSPRWMPWTTRAFVFRMQHPSSQVLIGVFDYDALSKADTAGRISVDITNFCPNTDYTLTYTLYQSVMDENRVPRGSLTIRLRMEIPNDFWGAVKASMTLPQPQFVNVPKRGDFNLARFITSGEENVNILGIGVMRAYAKELQEYTVVIEYIQEAFMTVVFWRGHYPVNILSFFGKKEDKKKRYLGKSVKFPVHSIVAFTWGIFLVENYNLLPSFVLFCIAWFFLATNGQRQRNPDPWQQPPSFGEMWIALLTGKRKKVSDEMKMIMMNSSSSSSSNNYYAEELQPLIDAYQAEEESRKARKKEREAKMKEFGNAIDSFFKEEEEHAKATAAAKEDVNNIATDSGRFQLRPFKPILFPIQKVLGTFCTSLRVIKSVVTWDESIYAFFITSACLIGSLILLFVPWSWMIRWILRIVVWVFLGPWMKLVDILVVQKLQADGDNIIKQVEQTMQKRSKALQLRKRMILIARENAHKLRAMKRYMFGKFIVQVPHLKEYRYPDIPLLCSSMAIPDDDHDDEKDGGINNNIAVKKKEKKSKHESINIVERKHGQTLVGDMIPTWGDKEDEAILNANASSSSSFRNRRLIGGRQLRLFKFKTE